MSKAYPQQTFSTDVEAIHCFAELLAGGYENPENTRATVRIEIPEYPNDGFVVKFGDTLEIIRGDLAREADTLVSIPIETLKRIFKEFKHLDFRDPAIIGTIEFSGNLNYANHLAKCCLRPNDFTLERFSKVQSLHKKCDYRSISTIEYLHCPTQKHILEVIQESRPVVITGLEPEPPCRHWTLERLVEAYGDAIVRVRSRTQKQNMREFVQELKDFMANPHDNIIEGFVKPYTEGAKLPNEMWDDFGPMFFNRADFIPPQLWLGAVPTHIPTSSLHRDPLCGFLLQVIGRKRLDLYSADQNEFVYPLKSFNNYQPCWFKPEDPDYNTYPKARSAKPISVVLNPGELIVQPAGWFHQVYALDNPNMSVSYFWKY